MGDGRPALRSLGIVLFAVAFIAVAAPAGGPASARSAVAHDPPDTVYLIPGLSDDAFYLTMRQGADAAARRLGVRLVYFGSPYAFSPAAQIPYLDAAIARRPDAILIAPTDRHALIDPIRRAVRAGIPVITVDTFIDANLAVTNVRSRNTWGGRLAADALARAVGRRGTVASISVRRGISSTDAREQGFAREIRRFRAIRYLGTRYDDDNLGAATAIAGDILDRHPSLRGIFAMNGLTGDGVIDALRAHHSLDRVDLVEFDADPIQVQALRQGIVDALVAQDPWLIGNRAVRLAYRWVTGRRRGIEKRYYTPEVILTRANVNERRLRHFRYLG